MSAEAAPVEFSAPSITTLSLAAGRALDLIGDEGLRAVHLNGGEVLRWRMHPAQVAALAVVLQEHTFPVRVWGVRVYADAALALQTLVLEVAHREMPHYAEVKWLEVATLTLAATGSA